MLFQLMPPLVDKAKAVVSVFDHGLLYGDGVFEGIRAYNGRVFKLGGLGMPRLNKEGKGDLHARLRVKLPESLDDKQKALFEELSAAGV